MSARVQILGFQGLCRRDTAAADAFQDSGSGLSATSCIEACLSGIYTIDLSLGPRLESPRMKDSFILPEGQQIASHVNGFRHPAFVLVFFFNALVGWEKVLPAYRVQRQSFFLRIFEAGANAWVRFCCSIPLPIVPSKVSRLGSILIEGYLQLRIVWEPYRTHEPPASSHPPMNPACAVIPITLHTHLAFHAQVKGLGFSAEFGPI